MVAVVGILLSSVGLGHLLAMMVDEGISKGKLLSINRGDEIVMIQWWVPEFLEVTSRKIEGVWRVDVRLTVVTERRKARHAGALTFLAHLQTRDQVTQWGRNLRGSPSEVKNEVQSLRLL